MKLSLTNEEVNAYTTYITGHRSKNFYCSNFLLKKGGTYFHFAFYLSIWLVCLWFKTLNINTTHSSAELQSLPTAYYAIPLIHFLKIKVLSWFCFITITTSEDYLKYFLSQLYLIIFCWQIFLILVKIGNWNYPFFHLG